MTTTTEIPRVTWGFTTALPITVAEARAHLRLSHSYDDATITGCILAARDWVARHTGRPLVATGIAQYYRSTEMSRFELLHWPVTSIDAPQYRLADYDWSELDDTLFRLESANYPAYILHDEGEPDWPIATGDGTLDAWVAYYSAGYTTTNIPPILKQAVLILTGHFYEERTPVPSQAVTDTMVAMLDGYALRIPG